MNRTKYLASIAAALALAGCSSVQMIDTPAATSGASCNVRVFQTRKQAEKLGEIEEICIINGTSAFSFAHTVSTAIEKHKDKACQCGANMVFVESRRESGLDVASVTMIAFRVIRHPSR